MTSAGALGWVGPARDWLRDVDWAAAMPLATQAAIAGLVVGCVPPLRHLLYGPSAPLKVVGEAIAQLGNGLVPAAIPVLGAVLYRVAHTELGASQLPWRVTAGVLLTRLVLQPALLTAVVVLCLWLGVYTAPDPMFLLTLLLANATPSAINLQMVTVLYGNGAEEMSQLLFFQYLAAVVTLPLYTRLFLAIIRAFVPP